MTGQTRGDVCTVAKSVGSGTRVRRVETSCGVTKRPKYDIVWGVRSKSVSTMVVNRLSTKK